jgi:adenosine deaminase
MDEIKQLIINGFEASFLDNNQKAAYITQVEKAWSFT